MTVKVFPTHKVDRSRAEQFEQLGSKPKFWYREEGRRLLFKAEHRGYGEDWAEVVSCHLCKHLGLPHVNYDLAREYEGDQELLPGVICENMAPPPVSLALGNQLLLAFDPDYPSRKQFKVREHTVESVSFAIDALQPPSSAWAPNLPQGVESAIDVFIGYIMLDAWIANQDRHHENWGALVDDTIRLAPTFDHAAGLARNLRDEERKDRLSTKDANRSVQAFANRGRSRFYLLDADDREIGTLEAFLAFGERSAAAKDAWLQRLLAVNRDQMWGILERVPEERMTPVCKEFTLELLLENQRRLLDQGNA